jgi:hypothetical protein
MKITKTETRIVFDRTKIGIGDIVEYDRNVWAYAKWYHVKKTKLVGRVCGIVAKVEPDCLWIYERDEFEPTQIRKFGLPVERADEVVIIRRHPLNKDVTE